MSKAPLGPAARRGAALLGALLAAPLLFACASDGGGKSRNKALAPRPAPASEDRAEPTALLVRVGSRDIDAADLLGQWLQRDSPALWNQLNLLIAGELARLEAERRKVEIDPLEVERRLAAHLGALRALWLERYPGQSFDAVLRDRLQMDPQRFRQRLRGETARELVSERVVRLHTLTSRRVSLSVLAAKDLETAKALAERVGQGEDFAALAKEHSVDPSAERGGRLPDLTYNQDAPLVRRAFAAPVGRVDGPFELGGRHVLLLVHGRLEAREGDWPEHGEEVLASLAADPVGESEFVAWQVEAERRWPVDVGPLLELLGEPPPPTEPDLAPRTEPGPVPIPASDPSPEASPAAPGPASPAASPAG